MSPVTLSQSGASRAAGVPIPALVGAGGADLYVTTGPVLATTSDPARTTLAGAADRPAGEALSPPVGKLVLDVAPSSGPATEGAEGVASVGNVVAVEVASTSPTPRLRPLLAPGKKAMTNTAAHATTHGR